MGGSQCIEVDFTQFWEAFRKDGHLPSEPGCLVDYLALLIQMLAGDIKVPQLQLVFSYHHVKG